MKLRSTYIAALALCAGGSFASAAPPQGVLADQPVVWSVHLDAERLRSGVGKELFADLDPILNTLPGDKSTEPGSKLESLDIFGLQPPKEGGNAFPILAEIDFSADGGGIARRFDAISKRHNAPIEAVAGAPTMHFEHQGKEVWIAKVSDTRSLVSTSRGLLEAALTTGTDRFARASQTASDELLGGDIEIQPLLSGNPDLRDSELLKLLPHLDFQLRSQDGGLALDAVAQLDSERSARRAARMIDGMVAGLAMRDPNGVPWDERLKLQQDGPRLAMQLHLKPEEARQLLDRFAHEIENHRKSADGDE